MWLPLILYLILNVQIISSYDPTNELIDLLIESLKVDPVLLDDQEVSSESKRYIDEKTRTFVNLVSHSQDAHLPRPKRSLDNKDPSTEMAYSINISPKHIIPTQNSEDIHLFQQENKWFAVSLENKNELKVYQYANESFSTILQKDVQYTTNVAVLSLDNNLTLIVTGEANQFKIFQFNFKENNIKLIQTIKAEKPKHVVLWEQNHVAYLSTTENKQHRPEESSIKIYRWLGKHFDLAQAIQYLNIKKTVPFNIHGSYFLAAVKYGKTKDELKSYSQILKFDIHSTKFQPYQGLLTNECTDIKYFNSELDGENHHFLIVVHSSLKGSSGQSNATSVIYKYEDQYFIPFQSISTNAVEWQPIQDFEGHAALLSVTTDGLKGFQYDGWHFFETHISSSQNRLQMGFEDIQALHAYDLNGSQILVIACNSCTNVTNIYSVNFTNYQAIKELHADVLSWCNNALSEMTLNAESVNQVLVAKSFRGDVTEQISWEEEQKGRLSAALIESNQTLYNIEDMFIKKSSDHIFEAEKVIFKDDTVVNSLITDSINGIDMDGLIGNILDTENGFTIEDLMEFDVLVVSEGDLKAKKLNNLPLKLYLLLNDNVTLNSLTVNGIVIFNKALNIKDSLNNNVTVTNKTLLLKDADQTFAHNLAVNEITVNNLTTALLNGVSSNSLHNHHTKDISHIQNLQVKDLEIKGYLNGVSVPVLARRALKKQGNQKLNESLHFESLSVENINIEGNVSEKLFPDDFVLIDFGEHIVNQDIEFTRELHTNKLEVLHALNNISVINNGDLNILLTESDYIQTVPTKKSFDNLITTNSIELRHKINNWQIQRFNPVIIDDGKHVIKGNLTVIGQVNCTRWLKFNNLKSEGDGHKSFGDILEKGIKLVDPDVSTTLTFTQPLDLEGNNIIADRVNCRNPHEWVLLAPSNLSQQTVTGQKRFVGDLYLEGNINALKINDVNLRALETEVLRVDGDQEIKGIWNVDGRIVTKGGIVSNKTKTNNSDALVINGHLKVKNLNTTNLTVNGLVNQQNISQILRNLVRKNKSFKIYGKKNFEKLYVDSFIIIDNASSFLQLLQDIMNDQITLKTDNLDIFNEIGINHLIFSQTVNDIPKKDFDNMAHLKSGSDIVVASSDMIYYDEITVLGEAFVESDSINGKNLTAINEDTVKADEDHTFATVEFGHAISVRKTLHLKGDIENLDLTTVVEQNAKQATDIQNKVFVNSVFVEGILFINNTVNGIELNKFCTFSQPSEVLKTLKIDGDVIFARGPKIANFNNLNMKQLRETLWFIDRPANISGTINLQNTTFNDSVYVTEFVDGTNLNLLSKNYLSKTKDQIITSSLTFQEVTFSNISTPSLITKGRINQILLDDVLKTVLIQGVPQVFESPAYFEEIEVQNINEDAEYSVNGLNLNTDVMRYDQPNVVTGQKTFQNLNVVLLNLTHNIEIQNVDVLEWLENAVLTNGTFSIKGKKFLKSGIFNQGLSLRGKLNGQDLNVMLVNVPQNVTGKKSFNITDEEPMKFKTLTVKNLINDIDLEGLVQNQTSRHQNDTLHSEIIFDNNVVVKNISVNIINNKVNVSELIANVSKLHALETYRDKFIGLLDMGMEVENTIKDQTTFFKYYKEVKHLGDAYDAFGINCDDGIFRLIAFIFENGTNIFRTFEWDLEAKTFRVSGENIESQTRPNFMQHVSWGDKDFLYIEHLTDPYLHQNNHYGPIYSGRLVKLGDPVTFEIVTDFHKNASTISLISFVSPGLKELCLGFVVNRQSGVNILCSDADQHSYYWAQKIPITNVYKATTVEKPDSVYLFLARHGSRFEEPSVIVFQATADIHDFVKVQTIFEGADLNGIAAATIGGIPHVALSFGSQEATVESGRISIRKLNTLNNRFIQWQHIPITAPSDVHFISETSFEPLLVVPSADVNAPLQIFRYNGIAGFKNILKGSSLPISSKFRIISRGHFLAALQEQKHVGTILGAVAKGSVRN